MPAASPYETALRLNHPAPTYVPGDDDKARVTAYQTYEDIYWNVDTAFSVLLRDPDGEDISRRYVPAARTIIEGTNRYLAKGMEWVGSVPADVTLGPEDVKATMEMLQALFKREEVTSKIMDLKRWMLIRGDGILHVTADPSKPEGTRLRIQELSPEHYFPIMDRSDTTRRVGVYIVQVVLNDDEEEIVQRIEYRRILTQEDSGTYGTPVGGIFYKVGYYALEGWDDRFPFTDEDLEEADAPSWAAAPEGATVDPLAGYPLPPAITSIPVYHFRNRATGEFGVSELQGIETLLAGITQVVTDQDIAVALQGIGVYWTDSGRPRDDQGNEVDWVISPASMLEISAGSRVGRVDGANDIESMLKHSEQLGVHARESSGTPDVAVGRVDVKVAESGIALAIQFAPVIAKNEETEEGMANKLDQMVYDLLNMWLVAYEGWSANGLVVTVHFGDPLPVNREAIVKEVTELVTAKVISLRFAAQVVRDKLGYDIDPVEMAAEVATEGAAALDAAAARMGTELGTPDPNAAPGGEAV